MKNTLDTDLCTKVRLMQIRFAGNTTAFAQRREITTGGEIKVSYACIRRPLTEADWASHITGEQPIGTYLILPDGINCYFGAVDIDNKHGQASDDEIFSSTLAIVESLSSLGIESAIARSSSDGYHIYSLNTGPYPAAKLRSIMYYSINQSGILKQSGNIQQMPEVFPKQNSVPSGSLGSLIRTPMSENRFSINGGRNLFVDRNNCPFVDQWGYLESIPTNDSNLYDEIYDDVSTLDMYSNAQVDLPKNGEMPVTKLLPIHLFENVLNRCDALRKISEKGRVKTIGHFEGFTLLSHALVFESGRQWFKENILGWDRTDHDQHQVDHFATKDYRPYTCRKIQESGLCTLQHSEACLLKRFRNGVLIEPNPIRFAFGAKNRRKIFVSEGE